MGPSIFSRRRLLRSIAGIGGLAITPFAGRARTTEVQDEPWITHTKLDPSPFQERRATYASDGYRLTAVDGYDFEGASRFAAVWERSSGPSQRVAVGLPSDDFLAESSAAADDGYRLTNLSGYAVSGSARFAAIWEQSVVKANDRYEYVDLTATEFQNHLDWCVANGYRPAAVSAYTVDGTDRYAAVWADGSDTPWYCHYRLTASGFADRLRQYLDEGYRPSLVHGYTVDGVPHYVVVWEDRTVPGWYVHHDVLPGTFENRRQSFPDSSFRPIAMNSHVVDGTPRFNCVWESRSGPDPGTPPSFTCIDAAVRAYMRRRHVPGISLAITTDERLVFAKGYGYADRQGQEPVTPNHRFRIASISKSVTAVAILRHVQEGDLTLDQRVFGSDGILGTTYGTPTHRGEWETVLTVGHLLQHTSGWGFEYDPAFSRSGVDRGELISLIVDTHGITHEPGTRYTYSNFGYVILEAILERLADTDYESHVTESVLAPCGVDGMTIGARTRDGRQSNEVVYHSRDGSDPYGVPLKRGAAAFGWIASPVDLLRFVVHVDGFRAKADVLSSAMETELYDREGVNLEYGEGWMLRNDWCGHNGTLPGSISFLVRRDDGISFAVLGNARSERDHYGFELRDAIAEAINEIDRWPNHDRL
jgi:CubicO group peptidase (beta-lactamase class C family)